jgi:hypothetical protein
MRLTLGERFSLLAPNNRAGTAPCALEPLPEGAALPMPGVPGDALAEALVVDAMGAPG